MGINMRTGIVTFLLIITSLLHSNIVIAQWFESTGQARIKDGNIQLAKTQAMQNALKKSLLVAGASVSSVQQVVNGLMTQDEINIRASGVVNSLELIDETHQNNLVNVTIRADIFPKQHQCHSADYKKSLLITRGNLLHREQANIGEIYSIGSVLMAELGQKLQHTSQYITPIEALKHKTNFARYKQSFNTEKLKDITMSLADLTDSQFILYANISDISFGDKSLNSWQFWQVDKFNRHLAFSIYVYNGNNGELIYQNDYHDLAPWPFNKRQTIDLHGQSFWQSDYGQMTDTLLNKVVTDLNQHMMCEATRAQILEVAGNHILINLGAKQGVQVGDTFSLLHWQNFVSDNGKVYAGYNVSPYKVEVTEVTEHTAKAKTKDDSLLGNIQRNDFAVKQ